MKIYKNIPIHYEDNHIIVVTKPCGIVSQKDYTNLESLPDILKEYIKTVNNKKGNVYLGLVHRLDKQVSGLMVFAKTSKAASRLSEQFRTHKVVKLYCAAIVTNAVQDTNQWHWLNDSIERIHDTTIISDKSKVNASLRYTIVFHTNTCALALIELYTGKKHQIRAQLSHYGMPIANDTKYGAAKISHAQAIALHAVYLQFTHPVTKEHISFYSEPNELIKQIFHHINLNDILKNALAKEGYLLTS